jgi:P-type E1-E2 ATPase
VSPAQKIQIIQKVKLFNQNAVTLAIGDGGNDVSMIMEANIGIGIYGEEEMSAA